MTEIVKQSMADIWASAGDIVAPDSVKINNGWDVEVVPRQYWNWMQNRTDSNLAYLFQHGIPAWDSSVEYIVNNAYVQLNGVVYQAILTGTNKNPTTQPTYWKVAFATSTAALEALKSVTPASNAMPYFTGTSAASTTTLSAFARTILDDADASAVRTTISAQQSNTTLDVISGLTPATNKLPYFTGALAGATTDLTAFARTILDDADAPAVRATISVYSIAQIDSQSAAYQPVDATLTALAGVTTAANQLVYATGSDAFATASLTAFARTILDDSDAATVRTTLGLGTAATTSASAYQPVDATLTALAGVTTASDQLVYATGSDAFTTTSLTAFARSILDDTSASAVRTTLGLANSATTTASTAATASTIVQRDASGNIAASDIAAVNLSASGTIGAEQGLYTYGVVVAGAYTSQKHVQEAVQAAGSSTVNISLGSYITYTATGANTWTFNAPDLASGFATSWTLELTNGGLGAQTFTGVKWADGIAPILTSAGVDIIVFTKVGTTVRGYLSAGDSK